MKRLYLTLRRLWFRRRILRRIEEVLTVTPGHWEGCYFCHGLPTTARAVVEGTAPVLLCGRCDSRIPVVLG